MGTFFLVKMMPIQQMSYYRRLRVNPYTAMRLVHLDHILFFKVKLMPIQPMPIAVKGEIFQLGESIGNLYRNICIGALGGISYVPWVYAN